MGKGYVRTPEPQNQSRCVCYSYSITLLGYCVSMEKGFKRSIDIYLPGIRHGIEVIYHASYTDDEGEL